ncbi:MAG: hypothetical protein U1F43_33690 [Myxococcota bacterium]
MLGLALAAGCHREGSSRRGGETDGAALAAADEPVTRGPGDAPDERDAGAARPADATHAADAPAAIAEADAGAPAAEVESARDEAPARSPDAPPPAPAHEIVASLPAGIVSKDLIGACLPVDADRALAGRVERCAAEPDEACKEPLPLGVIGFHEDGRVALVSSPWLDPCGGAPTYRVYEATMPWLHHDDETTLAPGGGRAEPAALEWVGKRLRRGFEPPHEVARWSCEYERWVLPVPGLTLLGEPLDRWMLTIGHGRRTLPMRLVGPSNKRSWDLDPIELRPGTDCEADEKKKGACAREVGAEVLQLALAPNRRSLVATIAIGTGEHCASARVVHRVLRLPDGVRSVMPKPKDFVVRRPPGGR